MAEHIQVIGEFPFRRRMFPDDDIPFLDQTFFMLLEALLADAQIIADQIRSTEGYAVSLAPAYEAM